MPFAAAAAIGAVGAIGGAAISANAAQSAAKTQAGAANAATQAEIGQFDATSLGLRPFTSAGTNALQQLMFGLGLGGITGAPNPNDINVGGTGPAPGSPDWSAIVAANPGVSTNTLQQMLANGNIGGLVIPKGTTISQGELGTISSNLQNGVPVSNLPVSGAGTPGFGSLVAPFTTADFQSSPGYNFQLNQGLDAVQNSATANGGVTGNTLKQLMTYGQGLANQDYWNAYNAFVQNQNNNFNKLQTVAGSGQNAAVQQGSFGTQTASQIGSNLIGAGNASAAGQVGSANAIGGAIAGGSNSIAQNFLLAQLLNGGGGGVPGFDPSTTSFSMSV